MFDPVHIFWNQISEDFGMFIEELVLNGVSLKGKSDAGGIELFFKKDSFKYKIYIQLDENKLRFENLDDFYLRLNSTYTVNLINELFPPFEDSYAQLTSSFLG